MKIKKGFTLAELIVTITIVVVLSVISVPVYREHVNKAKFAEAYTLLGLIRDAHLSYYNEYRRFLSTRNGANGYTINEPVLGVDARINKYFKSFYTTGTEHNFTVYLSKPYDLYKNDAVRYSKLCMKYDLTTGSTIYEIQ